MRIVSLIASSTEIVCRLGLAQELVGRSHECDFPEFVKDLPVCTSPKFNVEGSSYEIDQRVKAILQESLSVYRVDAQIVDALKPSHIITQAQCEVCAVSLKDVEEAACQFISSQPQIVSLEPNSLADIWLDIKRVGAALNMSERADKLVVDLSQAMSTIESATAGLDKPRVACIEWIEPLMAAGNWMPELIVMAGGINLFGEAGKHSPWMSFDQLFAQDPDIIIVSPCGFGIERTQTEMHLLQNHPGWNNLKAAKNKRVFVCDGNQYFNRPGPRVLESLEILAELFHPETFPQKHHGTGWVRADS
ncbi:MAG: cobalamin-binding protein [Candidatus Obscuribacterales bacterium]|nr:cobalamin-binding protein [Candidatus Obscuribacterales bacterium]